MDPIGFDLKKFLELIPPNVSSKCRLMGVGTASPARVLTLDLELHCSVDGGPRQFELEEKPSTYRGMSTGFSYKFFTYRCRNCGRTEKTFALVFCWDGSQGEAEVMKLGEYPPFAAPVSKRVEKLLDGEDLEMFRRGMRAEAQGLGIGAAAYYRRIVESHWRQLIGELRAAAEELGATNLVVFDEALKETQFTAAVEKLRSALPPKLLILNNQNPLTLLYKPLSVGLHGLTDEECLQQAADIRLLLSAMLENIAEVRKDQKGLQAAAQRLQHTKQVNN